MQPRRTISCRKKRVYFGRRTAREALARGVHPEDHRKEKSTW
jgi:hypothetical protein